MSLSIKKKQTKATSESFWFRLLSDEVEGNNKAPACFDCAISC